MTSMGARSMIGNRREAAARIDDVCRGSALLGHAAVLIWNDVVAGAREQFYRWHDKEHMPERLALPGFRRGRRFIRPGQSPEWLTLYEADDLGAVTSSEYLARLNAPTPATLATVRHFRNTSRAVCRLVHSVGASTGGHVLALRLRVDDARTEPMQHYVSNDAIPRAMRLTGIVACHLFAADASASYVGTAESTARAFDVPAWALLCESTLPDAAREARTLIDDRELERWGVHVSDDAAIYALEICCLSSAL
jgi:hypothetical protein